MAKTGIFTLQEFVKYIKLPSKAKVQSGSSVLDIKQDDVLRIERVRRMKYVAGVLPLQNRAIDVPLNCPVKFEVLHPNCQDVPTVDGLRKFLPDVHFVRVLATSKGVVTKGEILQLLFYDEVKEELITMDNQGLERSLPRTCTAGFRLLLEREEYTLRSLFDDKMLPCLVRFVEPVPLKIREQFLEDSHDVPLEEISMKATISLPYGVELMLLRSKSLYWLPLVFQGITISPLESHTKLSKTCSEPILSESESVIKKNRPSSETDRSKDISLGIIHETYSNTGKTSSNTVQSQNILIQTSLNTGQTRMKSGDTSLATGTTGQKSLNSGQTRMKPVNTSFAIGRTSLVGGQTSSNTGQTRMKSGDTSLAIGRTSLVGGQTSPNPDQTRMKPVDTSSATGETGSVLNETNSNLVHTIKKPVGTSFYSSTGRTRQISFGSCVNDCTEARVMKAASELVDDESDERSLSSDEEYMSMDRLNIHFNKESRKMEINAHNYLSTEKK